MAEASASSSTTSTVRASAGGRDGAAALAVKREFISINFDDDIGGPREGITGRECGSRRPVSPRAAAAAMLISSSNPQQPHQTIQAPIPRRARETSGLLPPLYRPASRSPTPPSLSGTPVGSVGGSTGPLAPPPTPCVADKFREAGDDMRLMWYLWEHADRYGLTQRPPATDRKPMMYGTVYARPRPRDERTTAEFHDGSGGGGNFRRSGLTTGGTSSQAHSETGAEEKVPACTFVLTTPDDDHRPSLSSSGQMAHGEMASGKDVHGGGGNDRRDTGADGTLDVLVFVIPPGQPIFRHGSHQVRSVSGDAHATATEARQRTLREGYHTVGGRRDGNQRHGRDRTGLTLRPEHSPPMEEVTQQTRHLVQRLLRVAMVHMRRDAAWRLFNRAAALATRGVCCGGSRSQGTDELRRRVSGSPHMGMSSPVSNYGCGDSNDQITSDGYSLNAADLRQFLALSVMIRLQDMDLRLREPFAAKHGVDWRTWFQRLVDSSHVCTLVFEDGDAVVMLPATKPDSPTEAETTVLPSSSAARAPGASSTPSASGAAAEGATVRGMTTSDNGEDAERGRGKRTSRNPAARCLLVNASSSQDMCVKLHGLIFRVINCAFREHGKSTKRRWFKVSSTLGASDASPTREG